MSLDWPGNVRELKNVIERLVIMTPGPEIASVENILGPPPRALEHSGLGKLFRAKTFREARTDFEREFIRARLQEHGGNVTQTAEDIEMDRTSLHKKMKSLGLIASKE